MNKALKKIFAGLTVLISAAPLWAAEFVADSRIVAGGKTNESKFYYAGDRWRMEEHLPKGEFRITIFRGDKKSLFVLWPDKKRYIAQLLPDKEFQVISTRKPGKEIERTELGKDTIEGRPVTKFRVRYDINGREISNMEWFSEGLSVVIRSQAEDNAWVSEISNIKETRIDNGLFEIPEDFQILSSSDVFKGPASRSK